MAYASETSKNADDDESAKSDDDDAFPRRVVAARRRRRRASEARGSKRKGFVPPSFVPVGSRARASAEEEAAA